MYYPRLIENEIKQQLFKEKIIIIYGPRQSGKTTLVKKLQAESKEKTSTYINCDELDYRTALSEAGTSDQLKEIIGDNELIIIDEGQRIPNIGLKLKLLIDNFPQQQVIATGSSSFDLANKINEPLTGRALEFRLYPLALPEMQFDNKIKADRNLESLLLYGSYPEVFKQSAKKDREILIKNIAEKYLYKDILRFQKLNNTEAINKLLQALALQIGNEVSYNELASLVGIAKETIASYLRILEQAFIIFRLPPFSRNLRKELSKLRKIYFWDLGVRNSLINNFNPLSLRNDKGSLWENFVIIEKAKRNNSVGTAGNLYFWRTYQKQEIDLIEEKQGKLAAFEIKWQKARKKPPKAWQEAYPDSTWQTINKTNYFKMMGLA